MTLMDAVPLGPIVWFTGCVVMLGGQIRVVNVASLPFVVPPLFVATARKWYCVLQIKPLMLPPPIETADVPDPSDWLPVELP